MVESLVPCAAVGVFLKAQDAGDCSLPEAPFGFVPVLDFLPQNKHIRTPGHVVKLCPHRSKIHMNG